MRGFRATFEPYRQSVRKGLDPTECNCGWVGGENILDLFLAEWPGVGHKRLFKGVDKSGCLCPTPFFLSL